MPRPGFPRSAHNRPRASAACPSPAEVRIDRLGVEADGLVRHPDGSQLFVPGGLPQERLRVRPVARRGDGWVAEIEQILEAHPARVAAPCRHFGVCGGCTLQHWAAEPYLAWKAEILAAALRRAGYPDPPIAPVIQSHPGERRRMDLAVRRVAGGVVLGLHRQRAAEVIDLAECHVLDPALATLLPALRRMMAGLTALRQQASIVANLLDSGPDLLLRTDAVLTAADRTALAEFAQAHGVARIAWAFRDELPETACLVRPPVLELSGVPVTPPPGGFLQATRAGEASIVAAVLQPFGTLGPRGRVAELFAGCGTLTFAIARHWRVTAWEGDTAAVAALRNAANHAGLAGRVTVHGRDLTRQPLQARELAGFGAVLLDPPHGGAAPQIGQIAASAVPVVCYVTCNPASLGRDAAALCTAGYRLASVQPIDQFLWSARLEAVTIFMR